MRGKTMIYFCADDYGISKKSNYHIENCLKNSVLNKVSILPNGEVSDFKKNLSHENSTLSLHINLVEGKPLSNPDDINLLISNDGCFKYSFIGLFLKSLLPGKKNFEKGKVRIWPNAIDTHPFRYNPEVRKMMQKELKINEETVVLNNT